MRKRLLIALVIFFGVLSASAFDTTPFQIGLWPPNWQIVPQSINVSGLKLNLPFGGNENITGLDVGLASTSSCTSALQVNLFVNRAHEDFSGLQLSLINQAGNANGVMLGLLMNVTDDKARGIDIGLINSSLEMHGIQIGLINYTGVMTGIQIGLVNIITESILPFFPIINFCF